MGGGDLGADAGLALGHDGVGEADDVDAFGEQRFGHARGEGVAEHDGDDGVFAGEDVEADGGHFFAEVAGVGAQFFAQVVDL